MRDADIIANLPSVWSSSSEWGTRGRGRSIC